MKTKRILIWIGIVVISVAASYSWAVLWHNNYCNGASVFFLRNRLSDILDTLWAAINEEVLWRVIPLLSISSILLWTKYDSNKTKKIIFCIVAFLIVLVVQIQFGYAHYNKVFETEDWLFKHIVLQGTMGLFYAISYNVVQHLARKKVGLPLLYSHLFGLLTSFIVHAVTNSLIIIKFTF